MIGLQELSRELAGYLTGKTGIAAFARRMEHPVYPALVVEIDGASAAILAGKQVRRELEVAVTCYPSRQRGRGEGQELADRVMEAVTPGFSVCGRGFSPQEVRAAPDGQERYRVTFGLEFFDLPENRRPGAETGETMGRLSLRICREKEDA